MIGLLRGTLVERAATGEVLVEVGGVGYRVVVPPGALAGDQSPGSTVVLHTHLHVREDALSLYGFASRRELVCFEALIRAHGVGPGLALAILSVHRPEGLCRAVADDDLDALCLVPGVGRKTAARLLPELKARLEVSGAHGGGAGGDGGGNGRRSVRAEVREALATLGYGPDEVAEAVADLPPEGDVVDLVRQALARAGGAR